jgi:hypothetical protein
VCGRLDGRAPRSIELVDVRGGPVTRIELTQSGRRAALRNVDGRVDFSVELPWATSVEDLSGGRVLADDPPRNGRFSACGVRMGADSGRLSFSW